MQKPGPRRTEALHVSKSAEREEHVSKSAADIEFRCSENGNLCIPNFATATLLAGPGRTGVVLPACFLLRTVRSGVKGEIIMTKAAVAALLLVLPLAAGAKDVGASVRDLGSIAHVAHAPAHGKPSWLRNIKHGVSEWAHSLHAKAKPGRCKA